MAYFPNQPDYIPLESQEGQWEREATPANDVLRALASGSPQTQTLILREFPDSTVDLMQVPGRQSSRFSLNTTISQRPLLAHAQSMGNGFGSRDISGTTQQSHGSSSNTWSSSEETYDFEDKEEREPFVNDYNKLATKVWNSYIARGMV